jgi:hypothetical protein
MTIEDKVAIRCTESDEVTWRMYHCKYKEQQKNGSAVSKSETFI